MLQRLSMAVAQVEKGNTSENLIRYFRQIILVSIERGHYKIMIKKWKNTVERYYRKERYYIKIL